LLSLRDNFRWVNTIPTTNKNRFGYGELRISDSHAVRLLVLRLDEHPWHAVAGRHNRALVPSKSQGTSLAVVYLDLDGCKTINDRFGHDIGDDLLVALLRRMQSTLHVQDPKGCTCSPSSFRGYRFSAITVAADGLANPASLNP